MAVGSRQQARREERLGPARVLVALVAEDPEMRRRFAELLAAAGLEVAAEDAPTLAAALAGRVPDVIVASKGSAPGITVQLRALRRRLRGAPVVAVLPAAEAAECRRAISAGADGAVLEPDLSRTLAATVAAAAVGQISFPPGLQGAVDGSSLTGRQRQVLGSMATGLTNAQIAARLGVSESTVKSHLSAAFTKLGVASRAEAAALIRGQAGAEGRGRGPQEAEASE